MDFFQQIDSHFISITNLAMLVALYFVRRTLANIDKNIEQLWQRGDGREARLATLEGEHYATMRLGGHQEENRTAHARISERKEGNPT